MDPTEIRNYQFGYMAILVIAIFGGWLLFGGPVTYDGCVRDRVVAAKSDAGARMARASCFREFATKKQRVAAARARAERDARYRALTKR